MRRTSWMGRLILAILFLTGTATFASDPKLPVIKGKRTVAVVGGEAITSDELEQALAPPEGGVGKTKPSKEETSQLLDRLINTRLIVQEARRMGIDQLPELKNEMDAFARVVPT